MSFKYINPGYIRLLNDISNATQIDNYSYCKNGVGFYQLKSTAGIKLPEAVSSGEFWAKFDFYVPESPSDYNIYFYDGNTNGVRISIESNYCYVYAVYSNNFVTAGYAGVKPVAINAATIEAETGLLLNAINTIWLHIKYNSTEMGYIEIRVNKKFFTLNKSFVSNTSTLMRLYSTTAASVISNIILSDEEISPKETIIALPITSNETDMTFDSDTGIYTANADNQTLMSTVNADYLANEYGSDSSVTGIALIGNPAYKTANGLTSLTAQMKENNATTDLETISLDDDTSAMIFASKKISNKTIADLQNIQFGWKAGT